jgi:hypothetical protein
MARHRKLTQKFAGFPIFKVGTSGDTFPVTSPFTTGFTGYGDGLSLDLQFAADKTLTARKGPTPVFTRGSTGTFVGSDGLIQSAAINAPRFDHDPLTLACKGLLIEESRTNLVLQSENHPSASWNKTGATVASASNSAPDGAATSNLVSEDISVGLHRMFQSTAYVSGTSYSISCFLKYAGRQFVAITHPTVGANGVAIFDIQNGTITLSQAGITSSIIAYPNGWYRCVVNGVSTTTGGSSHIIQGSTTGNSLTGSYLGLNGPAFYIYGSQVEAGAFPTSYIPTTTGSVVRSADLCSITGADFTTVYNQSEVSIFSEFEFQVNNASSVVHCNNGTSNEVMALSQFAGPSRLAIFVVDGGVTQAAINTTANLNQVYKAAISAKLNSFQFALGGVLGTRDTSGTMPTPTQINIGKTQAAIHLNGRIKQIKIFRKELSDAKLQALTA